MCRIICDVTISNLRASISFAIIFPITILNIELKYRTHLLNHYLKRFNILIDFDHFENIVGLAGAVPLILIVYHCHEVVD